jgi:segregation and condensation protein B
MSDLERQSPPKLSAKIEAILYLKAQPMVIQEIADLAVRDREEVEEALLELMQDYALRESALEVVETDAGFSLQLRETYGQLVHTVVPTDIGIGALRTLAVIALKGPIPQTELVELRGSGAYQHVQALVDEGFVGKRRSGNGRSYSVNVTQKFYQYFEVDELPQLKLKRNIGEAIAVDVAAPSELGQPETIAPPPEIEEEGLTPSTHADSTDDSTGDFNADASTDPDPNSGVDVSSDFDGHLESQSGRCQQPGD